MDEPDTEARTSRTRTSQGEHGGDAQVSVKGGYVTDLIDALARDVHTLTANVRRLEHALDCLPSGVAGAAKAVPFVGTKGARAWINGMEVALSAEWLAVLLTQIDSFGLLVLEQHGRVWCQGREVRALRRSPIQIRLLARLATTPGMPVSCEALRAIGWGAPRGSPKARWGPKSAAQHVAVAVSRLRTRLQEAGYGGGIDWLGLGYALKAQGGCVVIGPGLNGQGGDLERR